MQVSAKQLSEEVWGVQLSGSLDALTSSAFTEFVEKQLADGRSRLVVDLGAVDYIASAGVRALLGAAKMARSQNGDVVLAAPQEEAQTILEMTGVDSIVKIVDGVAAAIEVLRN